MHLDNPAHNPPVPFMSSLVCRSDIRSYTVVREIFCSLAYSSILISGLAAKSWALLLSFSFQLGHRYMIFPPLLWGTSKAGACIQTTMDSFTGDLWPAIFCWFAMASACLCCSQTSAHYETLSLAKAVIVGL